MSPASLGDPRFVGGHGVNGSEAQGPGPTRTAKADLSTRELWFPDGRPERDRPERYRLVHGFGLGAGARAGGGGSTRQRAHDRLVAAHQPHAATRSPKKPALNQGRRDPRRLGHEGRSRQPAGSLARPCTRFRRPRNPAHFWDRDKNLLSRKTGRLRSAKGRLARDGRRIEAARIGPSGGGRRRGFLARWDSARRPTIAGRIGSRAPFHDPAPGHQLASQCPTRTRGRCSPGYHGKALGAPPSENQQFEDFELHHVSRPEGAAARSPSRHRRE